MAGNKKLRVGTDVWFGNALLFTNKAIEKWCER